jgi:hypothetical protein
MGWNIGEEFGIGRIDVGDIFKVAGSVFLGKAALDAQAEAAKAQANTQNQTMKIITVAVIILITTYAIKRA